MRSSNLLSSLAVALPAAAAGTENCNEDFFKSLLPENATLILSECINENSTFQVPPSNIAYPTSPTNLPAACAVQINVTSSSTSAFSFGLFLPDPKNYNNRVLGVGNGGFAGGVNWLDMAAVSDGMPCAMLAESPNMSSRVSTMALLRGQQILDTTQHLAICPGH